MSLSFYRTMKKWCLSKLRKPFSSILHYCITLQEINASNYRTGIGSSLAAFYPVNSKKMTWKRWKHESFSINFMVCPLLWLLGRSWVRSLSVRRLSNHKNAGKSPQSWLLSEMAGLWQAISGPGPYVWHPYLTTNMEVNTDGSISVISFAKTFWDIES